MSLLATALPIVALPQAPSNLSADTSATNSTNNINGAPGANGPFTNSRITFNDAGLGACGETNTNDQLIVALDNTSFGNGGHCNQLVSITVNGITRNGTVKDMCLGCPYPGLDLTPSLFEQLANKDLGHVQGEWSFLGSPGIVPTSADTPSSAGDPQVATPTP